MTTFDTPWLPTGEPCKHGAPIERRKVVTRFSNRDPLVEYEERCCRECELEEMN